ncbi:hypothetical protein [Pontibacter liquoris]|uniref:hypothetical protein n=1 Tax=Pontibacter liquoris TaxID=2905677 RepID=UPI001FA6AE60|nr:hypothetical protein [Pontibacter liquoris]
MSRKSLLLLVLGAVTLSFSFIVKQYFPLTDAADGFIKGLAIGLVILSIILFSKQVRLKRASKKEQDFC